MAELYARWCSLLNWLGLVIATFIVSILIAGVFPDAISFWPAVFVAAISGMIIYPLSRDAERAHAEWRHARESYVDFPRRPQ